jgi:hypothetical protein
LRQVFTQGWITRDVVIGFLRNLATGTKQTDGDRPC